MGFEYHNDDGYYKYVKAFGDGDYFVRLRDKTYPSEQLGEIVVSYLTMGGGETDALSLTWADVDAMIAAIEELRTIANSLRNEPLVQRWQRQWQEGTKEAEEYIAKHGLPF